jgi:hypothetical protein
MRRRTMAIVKLTNSRGQTRNGTQWGPGIRHDVEWNGGSLCEAGCLHAYEGETVRDALALGLLMDPIHGQFGAGKMAFLCESHGGQHTSDGTKSGFAGLTTVREIHVPKLLIERLVEAAIRIAMTRCTCPDWVGWAEKWLSGEDRSARAAWAARAAAWAAAWAAARAAAEAAEATAEAAEAAAMAAARAAEAATRAAEAAAESLNISSIIGPILLPYYKE